MHAKSFNISVQGASHIKKNKECQDASSSYFDENIAIAVVCDGHGGNDYIRSAAGSRFAADIAERNIRDFVASVDKDELKRHSDVLIAKLEGSIIGNWNEAIYEHFEQNPFTEEEIAILSSKAQKKYLQEGRIESAYGTTLIAVVVTPNYWFGIHIGDGKCVAISPEGRFLQPIPWDEKCFLNATTSICDSSALENFRHFYSEKLPVAVFVGSDGIDDCFKNDQQLYNLYKTVLYSFTTSEFDSALSDLHDYLPRLSAKGSGDDVSVAAVLDMDLIGEIEAVKEFDKEKEKARIEENARLEAEKAEAERKRVEEERAKQAAEAEAKRRAEEARRKPQERKPAPSPEKYCRNCGFKLMPGMKFCSECGEKVDQSTEQNKASDTQDALKIIKVIPFSNESATDSAETKPVDVKGDELEAANPIETDGELTTQATEPCEGEAESEASNDNEEQIEVVGGFEAEETESVAEIIQTKSEEKNEMSTESSNDSECDFQQNTIVEFMPDDTDKTQNNEESVSEESKDAGTISEDVL